ncbi:hypothetical protein MKP08_14090 [Erythrobacter sp. LQ02-29]|uniref:hypothetical protein n=1 Tax=Erythrobacteraceae TaxID=335929 RepID=UPI000DC735B1|nr:MULTISPECIES: hypothetical protein [Erythrobacteraceae]MCP9223872.1 hypothetical protein [Erythrobacter sp. LQ02-29]BBC71654.1 conserved hypothetical protein [Altererythrobacter sp. B11]
MAADFHNDHDWWTATAALAVWAAHFGLAWSVSSVLPGDPVVLWITLALTLAAFAALAALWRWKRIRSIVSVAGLGIALAGVAVLWDFLPVLMA